MQQQTNAIKRLSNILRDAMEDRESYDYGVQAIPILLRYININDPDYSYHTIDFFALLSTVREEIGRMKNVESSRPVIEKLINYLTNGMTWSGFTKCIDDGNYIIVLNFLANSRPLA
jgi:hypothetical protein